MTSIYRVWSSKLVGERDTGRRSCHVLHFFISSDGPLVSRILSAPTRDVHANVHHLLLQLLQNEAGYQRRSIVLPSIGHGETILRWVVDADVWWWDECPWRCEILGIESLSNVTTADKTNGINNLIILYYIWYQYVQISWERGCWELCSSPTPSDPHS